MTPAVPATIAQIVRCHAHQNPADYGRPFIADPPSWELEPVFPHSREVLHDTPLYTEFCDRCGCSHGPASSMPPLEESP